MNANNFGWCLLGIYVSCFFLVLVTYLSTSLWQITKLRNRCYPNQRVDEALLKRLWHESRWERDKAFDSDLLPPGLMFAPLFVAFVILSMLFLGVRKVCLLLLAQVMNGGKP